jgi:hypothetical protein
MTSVSNAGNCPVGTAGDYYSRYVIQFSNKEATAYSF